MSTETARPQQIHQKDVETEDEALTFLAHVRGFLDVAKRTGKHLLVAIVNQGSYEISEQKDYQDLVNLVLARRSKGLSIKVYFVNG
jgi:hypothetical protein